ncbi:uncharacterized protein LOC113523000 [Galleria mellonella]|uniref:Uncharacterized protein LOC113523000 n=1 Tax=Galleria mellonella TaxID=7137 RepID=A0ABM3MR58_GALME|nr:uncharacterized protein LOC113523000 [Galleria mellonella]XP_052753828.1 uncharacterized protein LOC113523000 [Galleria mellonella]
MAYLLKTIYRSSRVGTLYYSRYRSTNPQRIVYSEEVSQAKLDGKPIVALESTIITHGMPYPKNLQTALQVEQIIREKGATPATVAILKGQLTVGLTKEQLEYLAQSKNAVKASRRDLAPVAAAGLDGATTVAGTIIAAELADIPIFVTGGIGGVHREGEKTLDVSADLNELGRSKTLVVCSGVKSILDIGRTLEYLETQGVCVCSYGDSNDFPAFYTPRSGYRAPNRVADARQAAQLLFSAHTLQLQSGIVIAVPVPKEYAMDEKVIEEAIQLALEEAKKKGIQGKEITPFILAAVAKATGGSSLEANMALIKNNAKVGAEIAVEFKKLNNVNNPNVKFLKNKKDKLKSTAVKSGNDVLVIGGANVDRTYSVTEDHVKLDGSTHPCTTLQCAGGVGRNIAEILWRLQRGKTRLLTAIGDDADGCYLLDNIPGLIIEDSIVEGGRTPSYAAVLDANGECQLGLGDMALYDHITIDLVNKHINLLEQAPLVILDGNVPQSTMNYVIQECNKLNKPVFFEPTDKRKAIKPLNSDCRLMYSSPNIAELRAMAKCTSSANDTLYESDELLEITQLAKIVLKKIRVLIITIGAKGLIIVTSNENGDPEARLYPAETIDNIINVSGAGDCFAGGYIFGLLSGLDESCCVTVGFQAAKAALLSKTTVPSEINVDLIYKAKHFKLDIK